MNYEERPLFMDHKDFSNLGDQIRDSVQDAIDSMDFKQLNRTISDTVNFALDEARNQMMKGMDAARRMDSGNAGWKGPDTGAVIKPTMRETHFRQRQAQEDGQGQRMTAAVPEREGGQAVRTAGTRRRTPAAGQTGRDTAPFRPARRREKTEPRTVSGRWLPARLP